VAHYTDIPIPSQFQIENQSLNREVFITMAAHPLTHFLNPQSVAIIGVSPNPSFINAILNNLIRWKYGQPIYPVNPNYPEIAGLKAYPKLADVPGAVELALISVPSRMIPDVLQQCEAKGVKGVNILTSGFEEIGGAEGARRKQWLRDFVQRSGIRIVGPNCFGVLSVPNNYPGMAGTYPPMKKGVLSLAFQSGGLAINLVQQFNDRQWGFAHAVSTGNETDLQTEDCLEYFAADEQTRVIACYVEQFRNPEKFIAAAARCAEARKPIVMIKIGRSEAGRQAAQAHTGSLVGSDGIIDATLKKLGVLRVNTLDEMMETLAIMHTRKLPKGNGFGAITFSGGAVGIMSDLSNDYQINFPSINEEGAAQIRKVLYEYGTVANPIDLTGQAVYDPPVQRAAFEAFANDPNIHTILVFSGGVGRMDMATPIGKLTKEMLAKYPDKLFIRSSQMNGSFKDKAFGMPDMVEPATDLDGVPFLQGIENTMRAANALMRYTEFQRKREARKSGDIRGNNGAATQREKALALVRAANGQALTESAGKQLLALYGIPVTQERVVTSAGEAAQAAKAIGFPVALKIVSPQIMHKTEAGGVALNVANEDDARAAFERIMQNAQRYNPHAELQGVSVQEMVTGGRETIVGMTSDPQFGPGIIFGLGGIFVEILKDTILNVPPLDADEAREMIESLKGTAILKGARGQKPADLAAIANVLLNFSQLCLDLRGAVKEIDINPLLVLDEGKGAKAVDCLIVPT
jgi:acetyltransferase